jgi:hypothetical protein
MKTPILVSLVLAGAAAGAAFAQPNVDMKAAMARWELLRASPDFRLSIDPKSLKARGAESSFRYLVDYRKSQGEVGGQYRSLVVGAKLQCKERRIALDSYQVYSGSTATGILLAQPAPSANEKRFQPIEKGSSDEELYQRVCQKGTPTK